MTTSDGTSGAFFAVWVPSAERVEGHFEGPPERLDAQGPADCGYHRAVLDCGPAPDRCRLRVDGCREQPKLRLQLPQDRSRNALGLASARPRRRRCATTAAARRAF